MAGCRALKKNEIDKVLNNLKTPRDIALFTLGVYSGFRISELLSLKVSDIVEYNQIVVKVRVRAMYMKGKQATRQVALNERARDALQALVVTFEPGYDGMLFRSRQGGAITRGQAHHVLKQAFIASKLVGNVATHTMRKTFAQTVYKALGEDLYKTAKAMGHRSLDSTVRYLECDQEEIDEVIRNA